MTYSLEVIGTFKRFEASPVAALANNGEAKKRSDSPSMEFGGGREGEVESVVENVAVVGRMGILCSMRAASFFLNTVKSTLSSSTLRTPPRKSRSCCSTQKDFFQQSSIIIREATSRTRAPPVRVARLVLCSVTNNYLSPPILVHHDVITGQPVHVLQSTLII